MNNISILDCTLRDGGYCNEWKFGDKNISAIISGLQEANVDIVECGFITNKIKYSGNISKFNTVEQFEKFIPINKKGVKFVAMINYGEYNVDDLPDANNSRLDAIRVAFHKNDMIEAINFSKKISEKGYDIFIQPMVSLNYTDIEFLKLIDLVNSIKPYAFYIVDSFGTMKNQQLLHFYYMVDKNLDKNIVIGYHSHNNMQMSYSNAQTLVNVSNNRHIIIDSSIQGMGRGAGNLNTELFMEYLNDVRGAAYYVKPLLMLIDTVINRFYMENYWGYSLPNYLSAVHLCHPNYAQYLSSKNTLTVENMGEIFDMMADDKKNSFDKEYIEELYLKYMNRACINDSYLKDFSNCLKGKRVLVIAPGKSGEVEKDKVAEFAKDNNTVTIAINSEYSYCSVDYIFVSNIIRYREINKDNNKLIITSNISGNDFYLRVNYADLLNKIEAVEDNAGLMAIKFLIDIGVKEIYIAGMDGYSRNANENYSAKELELSINDTLAEAMNKGMIEMLKEYSKTVNITMLTNSRYLSI